MAKKKIEKAENPGASLGLAESSASNGSLFKEDIPRKLQLGDVWENLHKSSKPDRKGLEYGAEEDSLMGRLAKRMQARDMIDSSVGLKPTSNAAQAKEVSDDAPQAKEVSDDGIPRKMRMENALKIGTKIEHEHDKTVEKINPKFKKKKAAEMITKDHLKEHKDYYDKKKGLPAMESALEKSKTSLEKAEAGMGLHQQTSDKKASNSSDPIPMKMVLAGNNMAQQARKAGKVIGGRGNNVGKPY